MAHGGCPRDGTSLAAGLAASAGRPQSAVTATRSSRRRHLVSGSAGACRAAPEERGIRGIMCNLDRRSLFIIRI